MLIITMLPKILGWIKAQPAIFHKWWGFIPVVSILFTIGITTINVIANPVRPSTPADYSSFDDTIINPGTLTIEDSAFINDVTPLGEFVLATSEDDFAGFILSDGSFENLTTGPSSDTKSLRGGLLTYKISDGDTLSTIAANFGISVNTIIWANNLKRSNFIKPGQEITILPVSGVLHEVRSEETIESIASLYGISPRQIATFNKERIIAGDTVVVPNAKPVAQAVSKSTLTDIGDYLAFPLKDGWNWGKLHESAVDISAACGTPIYASAEGLVESIGSVKNWNDGLGGFIRIRHPLNNIETLYAHTSANLVTAGDYVSRGDEIAKIGNTGKVQGPTGCHVHFGVFGAKHPFAK